MKDPAVLFYIGDWLKSTAEMDADCRGWYLNLLLHNYDKQTLPNDIESLAVLAQVKFSEYERFKQVFEHTLKHKFEQIENNRLTNPNASEILKGREVFTEKRSESGKMSYLMKYFAKKYSQKYEDKQLVLFVKKHIDLSIDTKNEQVIKHMFEHLFKLYINENEDENNNSKTVIKEENTKFKNLFVIPILELEEYMLSDELWVENVARVNKLGETYEAAIQEAKKWIHLFVEKLKADNVKEETKDNCFKYCNSWIKIQLKNGNNKTATETNTRTVATADKHNSEKL